jgi:hypothetical protein
MIDRQTTLTEMTVQELEAEIGLVWRADWQHPKTMTLGELRAEVARVLSKGMQQ